MKRRLALGTLLVMALSSRAALVRACIWEPVALHHSDPSLAQNDTLAPSQPQVLNVDVMRRSGLSCGQERCVSNSCGDTAAVSIELAPGQDDQTPPDQLGYRLELLSGDLPDSLRSLTGVALAARTPLLLRLGFNEVAGLDATMRVVAIDAAGNESVPSDPFVLAFDGCTLAAVGNECEDAFNPDTELSSPGQTSVTLKEEPRVASSACTVPSGSLPSTAYPGVTIGLLGLLAWWRQKRAAA
jgi:hypothetical protein